MPYQICQSCLCLIKKSKQSYLCGFPKVVWRLLHLPMPWKVTPYDYLGNCSSININNPLESSFTFYFSLSPQEHWRTELNKPRNFHRWSKVLLLSRSRRTCSYSNFYSSMFSEPFSYLRCHATPVSSSFSIPSFWAFSTIHEKNLLRGRQIHWSVFDWVVK